jgi:peptide methionine sulfoxide reductase MsrA
MAKKSNKRESYGHNTHTLINTIELDYDLIEVHYNPHLTNKPYLIRIYNYNNDDPEEIRLDKKDLGDLYRILKSRQHL